MYFAFCFVQLWCDGGISRSVFWNFIYGRLIAWKPGVYLYVDGNLGNTCHLPGVLTICPFTRAGDDSGFNYLRTEPDIYVLLTLIIVDLYGTMESLCHSAWS